MHSELGSPRPKQTPTEPNAPAIDTRGNDVEGLRTVTVQDLDGLSAHRQAWDLLALQAPQRLPTYFPAWMEPVFRDGLGSDQRWFCSLAYMGERLVGVLPVILTPHPLLGSRWPLLQTTLGRYSPSGDIVLASDCAAAALRALLSEVSRQSPAHLGLDLKAVRRNSPVHAALQEGLDGYTVFRSARAHCSFLNVEGDFDTYLAGLGSMRRNLKRFRKKLDGRGEVAVEVRKGADAGVDILPDFLALEAAGWKGRSGSAILHNADLLTFYEAMVRNFAAQERLEWHLIRVSGRLVAAQMAFRCGTALILIKWAFDEDFAECRLGTLLTKVTAQEAFSSPEIVELNTMSLSDGYDSWYVSEDEYVDLHLVRSAPIPALLHGSRIAMRAAYHAYVRPRIPPPVRNAWRRFKRRGDRKPRRAANVKAR